MKKKSLKNNSEIIKRQKSSVLTSSNIWIYVNMDQPTDQELKPGLVFTYPTFYQSKPKVLKCLIGNSKLVKIF